MANAIGWAIGLGLIFAVNFLSGPIHGFFENRVRPPAAATPRSAPFPLEVYYNAEVKSATLEPQDAESGLWEYRWQMTSKSKASAVANFYREKYPQAEWAGEDGYYEFAITPSGAGEDEHVGILVEEGESGATSIEIAMVKKTSGGFVPSLTMIRLCLWGMVLGVFTVGQRPLAQLLGKVFVRTHMAVGGSKFERLAGPPNGDAEAAWRGPQEILEQAGFRRVFDFRISNAEFPNWGRVLDKDGGVQAVLEHVVLNKEHYDYVEMQTHFSDGSTLTTSTSRYAGALKRPERHPLVQLPEGTAPLEVLRRHEEAVKAREDRGSAVMLMAPESLEEAWRRVETECLSGALSGGAASGAGSGGPLTEQGVELSIVKPKAEPARPVPVEEPPPAPPPAAEDKGAFAEDVAERLRQMNPALEVGRKDVMTLSVRAGNSQQDLDLETVYFMVKNNPGDKDKILAGFLGRFAPRR